MANEHFWTKSYDAGVGDLSAEKWEISYVDAVRPTFSNYGDKMAYAFMGRLMPTTSPF